MEEAVSHTRLIAIRLFLRLLGRRGDVEPHGDPLGPPLEVQERRLVCRGGS